MIRKVIFPLCFVILAAALAGCASKIESATTVYSSSSPTVAPSATDRLAPTSASTALPATEPILTATVEPTATPAIEASATPAPTNPPEAPATDTTLPPAVSTPAGPVIGHFQPGQAITITTVDMLDANAGWAVGGQGQGSDHVFTTADGGQTWHDVTPPEPAPAQGSLAALGFFVDANTVWVTYSIQGGMSVPTRAVVWHTQDGGQNWQSSASLDLHGLNELYQASDLVFAGAQDGWLLVHVGVGMSHDYVTLFRTTDGGQTWARLIDPYGDSGIQGCQKTGLVFPTAQTGWLTGDCNGVMAGAFLFQTIDGGQTWQTVSLPAPADAPNLFSDPSPACGTRSAVFFTPQAGKLIVNCSDYSKDPAVTSYYLYTTHDGGSTWVSSSSPAGALVFRSENTGWAIDRDLFHTTDGGQTWMEVKKVNWDGQFSFVSDTVGWAVARATSNAGTMIALVQTTDGGKSWTEIHPVTAP